VERRRRRAAAAGSGEKKMSEVMQTEPVWVFRGNAGTGAWLRRFMKPPLNGIVGT
jgi:hypothetical protein